MSDKVSMSAQMFGTFRPMSLRPSQFLRKFLGKKWISDPLRWPKQTPWACLFPFAVKHY